MEGGGGLRGDGEIADADGEIAWPREDGTPTGPAVGALEGASGARPRRHGGGSLGVDRQGGDKDKPRFGEPRGVPTATAVSALEDGVGGARVEDGRGLGVDPQGDATACGVQPGVDSAPVAAAVDTLEDADARARRVEGGGVLGGRSPGRRNSVWCPTRC